MDGLAEGFLNAVPGAYYAGQAQLAWQQGQYAISVVLYGGALADAAISVLTLGQGSLAIGAVRSTTIAARGAARGADEAFHYTFSRALDSIRCQGLRPGSYASPNGALSPLQAHIDAALPANRSLPDALVRIDLAGLRQADYQIPEVTKFGRRFGMPGRDFGMQFPYPIPP